MKRVPSRAGIRAPEATRISAFSRKLRYELAILLLPEFSQICLSAIIEPLRLANMLARRELFAWRLIGPTTMSVVCAGGIPVGVAADIETEHTTINAGTAPHAAIVCAGEKVERFCTPSAMSLFRLYAQRGTLLVGVNTGAWLLAKSGLLGDARCTIHWHKAAAFSEKFQDIHVESALFVRHGSVMTCSGGFAAFDMIIDIIERELGPELARSVCRYMTTEHTRDGTISMATPAALRLAGTSGKLLRAIRLMEANLENPLRLATLAEMAGTSRRQIERLFDSYLSTTPSRHYLSLRLLRARQLLESTDLKILEIAIACGFESSSHFSKTFRSRFGISPNSVRTAARNQPSDRGDDN